MNELNSADNSGTQASTVGTVGTLFLGCAVWSFKGWVGDFFPTGSRSTDFLKLYGQRMTTVEGNTTFYGLPDATTVRRWRDETSPPFRFCPKMLKDVTHSGSLLPQVPLALEFLHRLQGLDDRLGPIFAQLPPEYGPDMMGDLEAFLTAWPRHEAPLSLEVRNRAWFSREWAPRLNALLEHLEVGRVLLDSRPIYETPSDPRLEGERHKPRVPLQPVAPTPFVLVRYISHPDGPVNDAFLEGWMPRIDAWLREGRDIYFFVHCPIEAFSPRNAWRVQELLEKHAIPVPPLPWKSIPPPVAQLRLF